MTPAGAAGAAAVPVGRPWALVLLSLTAGLGGGAAAATTAFLVVATVAGGLEPGSAGSLLAAASTVAIAARLAVGAAADKRAGAAIPIVAALLALGALGAGGLAVAATDRELTELVGSIVLVGGAVLAIGAGWGWTGLVFLAAVRLDAARPAKAAGIVLAGLGLGGAAGPALFGAVAGRAGYVAAWTAATVALSVAAATSLVAGRLGRST